MIPQQGAAVITTKNSFKLSLVIVVGVRIYSANRYYRLIVGFSLHIYNTEQACS